MSLCLIKSDKTIDAYLTEIQDQNELKLQLISICSVLLIKYL